VLELGCGSGHSLRYLAERGAGVPNRPLRPGVSIWGLGWTTDLPATLELVADYLKPGGTFLVSGEHPAYSCLEWKGQHYAVLAPYTAEGARHYSSWKGVPIVIQRCTLGTFVNHVIQAGLQLEALIESPFDESSATAAHMDPACWYSVARARLMPTTFIIKARKPRRSS
jgi:hypothetical protein